MNFEPIIKSFRICLLATGPLLCNCASAIPLMHSFTQTSDTITKEGYTLIFINKDSAFSPVVKQKMIDAFFTVYPRQSKRFNVNTIRLVHFSIDPDYKGVAATGDGWCVYNPQWLHDHPADIDVVTHEVMHLVQAYPSESGPGWITEGIADYVRYTYGVNNPEANWALPEYKESQSYTNSYRVTARFFLWLEKKVRPSIVDELDRAMRDKTYTPGIWKKLTGKTLDELWKQYSLNPQLT